MKRFLFPLAVAGALVIGCADQPTSIDDTAITAPDASLDQDGPHGQVAYRLTGDFVSSQHTWSFLFEKMVIRDMDAWVDEDGNMGGSYWVDVYFVGSDEPLVSLEEVTCLSVDPATRQAWVTSARPDPEWGTHYSILQMQDLSPAAMSATGHLRSGRSDLYTGRTTPPWESGQDPHFCLHQPELSEIAVEIPGSDPFPATPMFPIDPGGDLSIRPGH
jgi:hypothetical protein